MKVDCRYLLSGNLAATSSQGGPQEILEGENTVDLRLSKPNRAHRDGEGNKTLHTAKCQTIPLYVRLTFVVW